MPIGWIPAVIWPVYALSQCKTGKEDRARACHSSLTSWSQHRTAWTASMNTTALLRAVIPLGIGIIGLLSGAERLYLVKGKQYPRFMAKDLGAVEFEGLERLRVSACNGDPLEVYPKTDFWVLRCGYNYFQGHTFISHADPFANRIRQGRPL
ncbi:hypothetical protein LMG19083_01661 [Ralstonia psammae]|uniref:Transmembrane protein n=2 Tax=Ralstonia psammae TaxID=3058598 RepID=A0ABN9IRT3_9RALS|nr:hypothetical protein LMG19083_01661 [Ralstonia sp. LMG 19083]